MSKEKDKVLQDADQGKKTGKNEPKEKKKFNTRKLKYGSMATAFTVIVIAVIVLVNILAGQFTDRFGLKIDTTKEQLYEISSDTVDYLKTLEDPVEISVMADEDTLNSGDKYYKLVKEITDKYAINSDKVTVNYYDTEKNPDVVTKFTADYSGSIRSGDIVISCDSRVKVVSMSDLYEIGQNPQTGQSYIKGIKADQELTSAIMFVADPTPPTVAILSVQTSDTVTVSLKNLQEVIEKNGYKVETINPLTEEISSDISMIILPAPQTDLTDSVIEKIDTYLYNDGKLGKNLFYFANIDQAKTPKIDTFLEEWGIKVENGYIFETDQNASLNVPVGGLNTVAKNTPLCTITDSDSKSLVNLKDTPFLMPLSRPVTLLFDQKDDRETKAIITTSDTSAVITSEITSVDQITDDQKSSKNVIVLGSKHIYDNAQQISSNVIVSGSAYMLDYYFFSDNSVSNQEFTVNLINRYTGKNDGITILSKDFESTSLNIEQGTAKNIRLIVMFIIPLAVVIAGIVVFIRRRNR